MTKENQESEAYVAGYVAGFRYGRDRMENAVAYMRGPLEDVIRGLAQSAFRKYKEMYAPSLGECAQKRDEDFARDEDFIYWAKQKLGWDVTGKLTAGISKSIPAMRAYFKGQAFYIDEKNQERKVDRQKIRELLSDMDIIRKTGLRCVLQDFVTKNIKIEDEEGHIFAWYQGSKSLCLVKEITLSGEVKYFRSSALLPKSEQTEGAKCTVEPENIAAYIEKEKSKIRWMWQNCTKIAE